MDKEFDCIVLGGGPAGLSASIYLARANVNCCIIDKGYIGGRLQSYLEIENYLGLGRIETFDMLEKFREHVEFFNVPIFEGEDIKEVDLENKIVYTKNHKFHGKAIIIATGSRPKLLNVPGEKEYVGKGVHYCAICDGHFYKDKVVAVIGGGNSACEEALGLSKICNRVNIIEFTDKLNADKITLDKIYSTSNIGVHLDCQVTKIEGKDKVEKIWFKDKNSSYDCYLDVNGIFPYIGMTANSEMFDLDKDANGFICSDARMQTDILGVYVVGDIRAKVLRQVVTAVSDGAIAGVQVGRYLG